MYCSKKNRGAGTDSKFFATNRKGENHELKEELRSPQRDRKRDAVKKVLWLTLHLSRCILVLTLTSDN